MTSQLIFYPDSEPGITRKRQGRGFSYFAHDGTSIDAKQERDRIKALAVPPAYERVWICPKVNGHLQATGRDTKDRKQYRYHPDWRAAREARKYDDLLAFGTALPRIRRRVRADLSGDIGDRDVAISAIVALIDKLSMRVGNAEYAKENRTFGATTLQARHITFEGDHIKLKYQAKGNKTLTRLLREKAVMRILERLHDLPGANLVTWLDDSGTAQSITSDQVNDWLSDVAGCSRITAKTFRTWAGSEAALKIALSADTLTIKQMSDAAASRLGNTPTIARKSYIHPDVIALADAPVQTRAALCEDLAETSELRIAERALLRLLS